MYASVTFSVVVHAVIIAAAVIGLPDPEEYDAKLTEAVPVEILTVSELTQLQAQKKDAKPTEKIAPEKVEKEPERPAPKPAEEQKQIAALEPDPAPPPPEPEPEPKPEAVTPAPPQVREEKAKVNDKPEPKPEPDPQPEPKSEELEKPKAAAKPVPRPKIKPKPPKRVVKKKQDDFNLDQISALLDKSEDKNQRRIDPSEIAEGSPTEGDIDLGIGSDAEMTLDEKDALRAQIERCWNPPTGAAGAQDLLIKLRISLRQDGTLQSPPVLVNSGSSQYFQVAAESAIRAVRRCEPYQMPAEKYGAWRQIILNFNPAHMYRG